MSNTNLFDSLKQRIAIVAEPSNAKVVQDKLIGFQLAAGGFHFARATLLKAVDNDWTQHKAKIKYADCEL